MEKINRRIYICLAIALIILNIVIFAIYKEGYFKTSLLPVSIVVEGLLYTIYFYNHVMFLITQSPEK